MLTTTDTLVSNSSQLNSTEQRLQEQFRKLEEQFVVLRHQTRQAQKLASLGTTATMLAHEFNNLMSPVVSYARYALDHNDAEMMAKALAMTLKQTGIVTAMSDRILGLAANEERRTECVNVRQAVADAEACLCRDLSKDGITLVNNVAEDIHVTVDPRQLQQVLFNLFINARQAITHRHGRVKVVAEPSDGDKVTIRVSDNGTGIPAEKLEEIFDAFYTSKQNGRPDKSGIGVGLTLCKEIVEESDGRIDVESTEGEGTSFIITLPVA